jgi:transposase InsO family protein
MMAILWDTPRFGCSSTGRGPQHGTLRLTDPLPRSLRQSAGGLTVYRPKLDDEQSVRPWLTIIIDDYSRAIAGFSFSFGSVKVQTALALRQAIWRKAEVHWVVFGIPEVLCSGNGSDFTSKHLEQVAADIELRLIFSTPRHPRGRGRIERFFETLRCSPVACPATSIGVPFAANLGKRRFHPRSAGNTADLFPAWRTLWNSSICSF